MTQPIAIERFTTNLFQLFDETFEQVRGIYLDKQTSLFETLETISAEVASRPSSTHCASIAAHVEHLRFYLEMLEKFFRHEEANKLDWGEIWRTVRAVTPQEWEESKERLRATYQQVRTTLQTFDEWEGEDAMGDAMAMVIHTAYHLGEIRQMLCAIQ